VPVARGVKVGIITTVAVAMFSVAGYGAYNVYTGLTDNGGGGDRTTSAADIEANANKPVSAQDAAKTAADFLKAWSAGDITKAAALTTRSQSSTADMNAFASGAKITKISATPKAAKAGAGATVAFSVKATVSYPKLPPKVWTYDSSLTVGRNESGQTAVKWAVTVMEPDLQPDQVVLTGRATSPDLDLVDRNGLVMTAEKYPGLTDVFADLRKRYADADLGGTPGIETFIADPNGDPVKTLMTVKAGKNAQLKTTLDAKLQTAAEKAVKRTSPAGVTALDTGTGKILAMASNPPAGTNYALALKAPGSTFKIVTATALMLAQPGPGSDYPNGIRPSSRSQCYSGYANVGGRPYKNVTPDNGSADLAWDFAKSCNTGFIRLSKYLTKPNGLSSVGARYFGLGGDDAHQWFVGTGTNDGSIPGGTGDEFDSEMIGQGQVQMTTLNMASVSATVADGRFHQPSILEDNTMIDKRGTIPTSPLPGYIQQNLKSMMRQTVDNGTATGILTGVDAPYGAKTGSAEESQEGEPNGWFTAYSGHVAAAALVVGGGHGGDSAGPIVTDVLRAASRG
jgi:transpeptidase family protein/MecA-like transpeptidase family protein